MILGKSFSMDSGVCVCDDKGEIVFAMNEERASRKKLTSNPPKLSENIAKKIIGKRPYKVVKAGYFNHFGISEELYEKYYDNKGFISFIPKKDLLLELTRRIIISLSKLLSRNVVEHHLCHAAGAYYTSGLKKALIITMDAYGDGYSTTVSVGKNNYINFIAKHRWGETAAQLYARITEYLGFKSHRHEGKITGLAAYGDSKKTYNEFKKMLWFENGKVKSSRFLIQGFKKSKFDKYFKKHTKEDIAAGLQRRCEDVLKEFVSFWVDRTGIGDVVLAGGLFANVKLNQEIHELPKVKSIYIFPHMGDGGLALGAALAKNKPTPKKLETLYLGPKYTDKEIKTALDKSGLKYNKPNNIEKTIATLIAKNKVVARFNGRMEYGPRALGNRSILYTTTDPKVNDWLNKKLQRTEFMPFAPATIWEKKDECYQGLKGAENTAKNMTITFNCTKKMREQSPGVVHIDGTARPQLVKKEDNPQYHKIIYEYYKQTGIPSIINTSFNIHEEPIVNTPTDAIHAFKQSKLDHLAIGPYII